jgi:hypothetical protein
LQWLEDEEEESFVVLASEGEEEPSDTDGSFISTRTAAHSNSALVTAPTMAELLGIAWQIGRRVRQ